MLLRANLHFHSQLANEALFAVLPTSFSSKTETLQDISADLSDSLILDKRSLAATAGMWTSCVGRTR